ncbi:hypothetical protein [Pararhizobium sp. PWRC1-1]|uniref:hypothetical protein n=1 Tax=Pararhizobium sp. PWRC1-1 TaxID=2804566 RepID=UPI003CF98343
MAKFLIAYDLKQQGQNYTCIINKLKALGAFHSQKSVWLLKTNTTNVAALRDHLKDDLDENDQVIVVQFDEAWASWNMNDNATYLNG